MHRCWAGVGLARELASSGVACLSMWCVGRGRTRYRVHVVSIIALRCCLNAFDFRALGVADARAFEHSSALNTIVFRAAGPPGDRPRRQRDRRGLICAGALRFRRVHTDRTWHVPGRNRSTSRRGGGCGRALGCCARCGARVPRGRRRARHRRSGHGQPTLRLRSKDTRVRRAVHGVQLRAAVRGQPGTAGRNAAHDP